MNISIRIVTHCYAARLPHYAAFLRYQLSSLILHPPNAEIQFVLVLCETDSLTLRVVRDFADRLSVDLLFLPLDTLGRRSIGRNIAALSATEDLVWFADVDYLFGDGCLDSLCSFWESLSESDRASISLLYPKTTLICKNHALGDQYAARAWDSSILDIDPSDFVPMRNSRAIGGIQIVPGWYARRYGYLKDKPKWLAPADPSRPFADFRDDVAFRRACLRQGRSSCVDLPSLFRLRHSECTH